MYTGFSFKFDQIPDYKSIMYELISQTKLDLDYTVEIIKEPHKVAYQLTEEVLPYIGPMAKLKVYSVDNEKYNYELSIFPSIGQVQMDFFAPKEPLYFVGKVVLVLKSLGGVPEYEVDSIPDYLHYPFDEARSMEDFRDIPFFDHV